MAGQRSAQDWRGQCPLCELDSSLGLVKVRRWTLRELFTSRWTQADFRVQCQRCGGDWPIQLGQDRLVSLAERLGVHSDEVPAGSREGTARG